MPRHPIDPTVPIIGQALYQYPYGHTALAFPISAEESVPFFQSAKAQGWQPDPGFVLVWIASAIQTQTLLQALLKAQKRIEALEDKLGLARGETFVNGPPPATEDPPQEPAGEDEPGRDLPDWAKKAAQASEQDPFPPVVLDEHACIICGCTDVTACTDGLGRPCSWVELGDEPGDVQICSACADAIAFEGGCRRCVDCSHCSHHWMEGFEEDEDGEILDPNAPRWGCKHCEFSMPYKDEEPEEQFQALREAIIRHGSALQEQREKSP